MYRYLFYLLLFPLGLIAQLNEEPALLQQVSHGYADNDEVKLHYVSIGEGPLVVFLHGFPDYWYTWRDQMMALKDNFQVVAMDLRGYNLSGQPKGVENYKMQHLMKDVIAVVKSLGKEKAIIVGHDWGGAIAWRLAIHHPEVVEKLIVCNMTHPTGGSREALKALQANGNTSYMDAFRTHTSETLSIAWLSGWVKDPAAKEYYKEAFARSDIDGMINYYKANTSTKEERAKWLKNPEIEELPKVQMPVLAIFGTQDRYVRKGGLNDTWNWLAKDFTLVTLPEAGHFVQQDASEMVSKSMKMWLLRDKMDYSSRKESLKDLKWLLGTWKRERNGRQYFEEWTQSGLTTFEGKGFVVSPENKDTIISEHILLSVIGESIYFIPKVEENAFPVPFKLVSSQDGKFVFENPAHDFPQRIEYERTKTGQLKAVTSDIARQKEILFQFKKE